MLYYKEREYLATVWDHLNFPPSRQMPFFEQASHPTFILNLRRARKGLTRGFMVYWITMNFYHGVFFKGSMMSFS